MNTSKLVSGGFKVGEMCLTHSVTSVGKSQLKGNTFTLHDRVEVVSDGNSSTASEDNLVGWKGTVTKVWPEGAVFVDLDPEQDPDCDLTQLYFSNRELKLI